MKKIIYTLLSGSLLLAVACSEKEITPTSASLGKPNVVTDVTTEPISGGVILNYRIPQNEDLLGVKVVYKISNGNEINRMVSYYNDTIRIEGYIDEEEHTADLYTVNRAMVESDPVNVSFVPRESALTSTVNTMKIKADFGGAIYEWENENRGMLNLDLLATDSVGALTVMKVMTTSSTNGSYSLNGYDTEPRWFAAIFRDNYGNASDTIFPLDNDGNRMKITPFYEEKLDKKIMNIMSLKNDRDFDREGGNAYLIDDDTNTFGHTVYTEALPAAITIDLGQTVKLSRIVVNGRLYADSYFNWGNPRVFDVFTIDHKPDESGNWDEWQFVMNCEVIKPSGLDGSDTDEDIQAGQEGSRFSFPLDMEPTQYVRMNITEIWTKMSFCHISEITLYGEPTNDNP